MSDNFRKNGPTVESAIELIREEHASQSADGDAVSSKAKRGSTRFMVLLRRVHLYSGIFMFPFVLLYGFTGWFFNHPSYFTGDQVVTFSGSQVAGGALDSLPPPDELARSVVAGLNTALAESGGPKITLTESRTPLFTGFLTYSVEADGATHRVSVNPVTGDGEVRTTFETSDDDAKDDGPPSNPLDMISEVDVDLDLQSQTQDALPAVLEELGLESGEVSNGRRTPSLVFSAAVDGVPTVVTYNLGKGSVGGLREDSESEISAISFLQRMHLSRRYSPQMNIRWLWALQVDLMFVSMVFWGTSGLLMWWQIKRTRWLGIGFLTASVISAVILTAGMHDGLTKANGRISSSRQAPTKPPAKPTVATPSN